MRNRSYESSRDNAVLLRDVINGTYYAYRIFHAGMATPVPVATAARGKQRQGRAQQPRNLLRGHAAQHRHGWADLPRAGVRRRAHGDVYCYGQQQFDHRLCAVWLHHMEPRYDKWRVSGRVSGHIRQPLPRGRHGIFRRGRGAERQDHYPDHAAQSPALRRVRAALPRSCPSAAPTTNRCRPAFAAPRRSARRSARSPVNSTTIQSRTP